MIDDTTQDLLASLVAAGLPVDSARSVIERCQSEPVPGLSYGAGITANVGEDPIPGFDALVSELDRTGWFRTEESLGGPPTTPSGRFTRDGIQLDITTGGFTSGDERFGADEMQLGLGLIDDCVRVDSSAYMSEVEDLEKDFLLSD